MCYIILNLLIILYLSDFISVFLLHCLLAPARGVFAITVPGGVEATIGQDPLFGSSCDFPPVTGLSGAGFSAYGLIFA